MNILPNVENYIKVDVIDISGKTIYSTRQNGNTTNNNINIDLPERGIYIISIQTDKGNIVRKVIYQ
ncbi:T9SS type A sorting domain-containing protein [Bacteroides salyersiae]|nr:T9SS type A sorting domain-containing protein [Bacteroides salyersiae]